jgi:hypothetical protein
MSRVLGNRHSLAITVKGKRVGSSRGAVAADVAILSPDERSDGTVVPVNDELTKCNLPGLRL